MPLFHNSHPNYFYTQDNTRIFYNTNFVPSKYDPLKKLLIFNYGLVCNNAHWKHQIPCFDSLGYQILIHDYRYHYSSSGDPSLEHCDFEHFTNDLKELLDSFGAGQNIIMIGHSMGVNVTLEFAKKYPSYLLGMVLISGTVLPPQDVMFDSNIMEIITPGLEKFTKQYPGLFGKFWKFSHFSPLVRAAIHKGGFNIENVSDEFVQVYMKRLSKLPQDIFLKLLSEMKKHDILSHLSSLKVPTLIIGGDKDKVIPNRLQKILHRHIPNSELYIVRNGSHVPQADFPESINRRIKLFIEKLKGSNISNVLVDH